MIRFTAWLSDAERDGIDKLAEREGTSANYMVRVAVRQLLSKHGILKSRTVTNSVTSVTGNK